MRNRGVCLSAHVQQDAGQPDPVHGAEHGEVQAKREKSQGLIGIEAAAEENGQVEENPERAQRHCSAEIGVFERPGDQRRFACQHHDQQDLGANDSEADRGGAAACLPVGNDVHDLPEQVRMHREQGAEEKRGPGQLRQAVQPAAEGKYQQVARLISACRAAHGS